MTLRRPFVSASLLAGCAALLSGCADDPGYAWVDMDAMTPPGAVMTFSQLVAEPLPTLGLPTAADVEALPPRGGDVGPVFDAQMEGNKPNIVDPVDDLPLPPSYEGMDQDQDAVWRRYQLAWAQVGVGEVSVTGTMDLSGTTSGGTVEAGVDIALGPELASLELRGTWWPIGTGVRIDVSGSFIDPEGLEWRTEARDLHIDNGCAGIGGGTWTADARGRDGTELSFEIVYEDGCTGCAELFVDGTALGTSCLGS